MNQQQSLFRQPTDLEAAFEKFDRENPQIWSLFCTYAQQAITAGIRRIGVALIIERIRWQTLTQTTGARFKIPNAHRAYYARKWRASYPQHDNLFAIHKVKGERQ